MCEIWHERQNYPALKEGVPLVSLLAMILCELGMLVCDNGMLDVLGK